MRRVLVLREDLFVRNLSDDVLIIVRFDDGDVDTHHLLVVGLVGFILQDPLLSLNQLGIVRGGAVDVDGFLPRP